MSHLEVPGILRLGVKLFAAQLLASSSMAQMDAEDASGVEVSVEAALDLSDYRPTFEENFDRLDVSAWGPGTRWIAHTPWRGDFGDAAFADPTNDFPFTISSGILRIEARKEAAGYGGPACWRRPIRLEMGFCSKTDTSKCEPNCRPVRAYGRRSG